MNKQPQEGFFILQKLIKGKWKSPLIQHLNSGNKRPKELLILCQGISAKVLNEQLKQLEQDGLVTRHVFPEAIPIKVEYSLTSYGSSFIPTLIQLCELGEQHAQKNQFPLKNITYGKEDHHS